MLPLAFVLSCSKQPLKEMKPQSETMQTEKVVHRGIQQVAWDDKKVTVYMVETRYPHGANTGVIAKMGKVYTIMTELRPVYLPVISSPVGHSAEVLEYAITFTGSHAARQLMSATEVNNAVRNGEITVMPLYKAYQMSLVGDLNNNYYSIK